MEKTNFENNKEKRNSKEYLHSLESQGLYVFHGSPFDLGELEPQQAHQSVQQNDGSFIEVPDGEPAVYATPNVDVAIFMSLFNGTNFSDIYSGFYPSLEGPHFWISQNAFDQLQKSSASGFIYVFNMEDFKPQSSLESVSYNKVKPLEIIKVTIKDLPENIEVRD